MSLSSSNSNPYDTSFLPQQPNLRPDGSLGRREPIALGMIIALVVFFVTLAVGGGTYLYKKDIERRIDEKNRELASMKAKIDLETIEKLGRVSRHLDQAEKLLVNHTAFSLALGILSAGTAVNVGYDSLRFGPSNSGAPTLALTGIAPSYEAVYFQEQALPHNPNIKSAKVINVTLDPQSGTVSFEMEAELSPDAVRFGRYFEDNRPAFTPSTPITATSTTSVLPLVDQKSHHS